MKWVIRMGNGFREGLNGFGQEPPGLIILNAAKANRNAGLYRKSSQDGRTKTMDRLDFEPAWALERSREETPCLC